MSDFDYMAESNLVEGRTCGACTVCCVALTIDDPELQKLPGYRCHNLSRAGGCGIYDTRPTTCRTYYCGWRLLKWIRQSLRPDLSGVLVRLHGVVRPDGIRQMGVEFSLLNKHALRADGLAESVAAAVAADIPVFLRIPGPPGFTAGSARINDALRDAVRTRNKPALLRVLREARAQGLRGKHLPVVFEPHPSAAPGGPPPPENTP